MNLEQRIDEPIKKVVVGLALLGFQPLFSCCGFSYKGEQNKAHILNKPYVLINMAKSRMTSDLKALLIDLAFAARWTIEFHGDGSADFHGRGWEKGNIWNFEGCPYRCEAPLLSINALERAIESRSPMFASEATIRDGNAVYKYDRGLKHWQDETCEDWVVTEGLFNSL